MMTPMDQPGGMGQQKPKMQGGWKQPVRPPLAAKKFGTPGMAAQPAQQQNIAKPMDAANYGQPKPVQDAQSKQIQAVQGKQMGAVQSAQPVNKNWGPQSFAPPPAEPIYDQAPIGQPLNQAANEALPPRPGDWLGMADAEQQGLAALPSEPDAIYYGGGAVQPVDPQMEALRQRRQAAVIQNPQF